MLDGGNRQALIDGYELGCRLRGEGFPDGLWNDPSSGKYEEQRDRSLFLRGLMGGYQGKELDELLPPRPPAAAGHSWPRLADQWLSPRHQVAAKQS